MKVDGGGLSGLEKFSSDYKETTQGIDTQNIKNRLKKLKKSGLCILIADDDNPTEVMDRIPENFPYIIIYPSQTDEEDELIVSYGESMWEGWCEYYRGRDIPKWNDINPDKSVSSFITGNKNSIVSKWDEVLAYEAPTERAVLRMGFMPE